MSAVLSVLLLISLFLPVSPSRCGSERVSTTTIPRARFGRRCLSLGRWSRLAAAQGNSSGRCCGRGSSLSGRASTATAPKVQLLPGEGGMLIVCLCSVLRFMFFYNPGSSWAVVDSPSPDVGAIHVAVGVNVVWAVTKDNKVRKCCDQFTEITPLFWNPVLD